MSPPIEAALPPIKAQHLPIEALVLSEDRPSWEVGIYTSEYRSVFELCRSWRSVAEVAAVCGFPLGAARALIADMAGEGLLRIHQPPEESREALLAKLLDGLNGL
jgi:hypothetical protein